MINGKRIRSFLAPLFLVLAGQECAVAGDTASVNVSPTADGRTFTMSAPGWDGFEGGFSAMIVRGDRMWELSSTGGRTMRPPEHVTEATPFGQAGLSMTTIRFDTEEVDLLFRLGRVPGMPGALAQVGIHNAGKEPLKLLATTPVSLTLQVAGRPAEWLITGLHTSMLDVTALDEFTTPLEVHEAGGCYKENGTGFLFGPVGAPTAFVNALFKPAPDGRVSFQMSADMSGARVDPGETRWGQQVALFVGKPNQAMARWAEWVGKTHGARTSKGALSGWNSWNFRTNKTNEKELLSVVDAVRQSGGRLRPGVIQIDDAVEPARNAMDAPWLPLITHRVGETGARFGLRLSFDRNSGSPAPDAAAGIAGISETVRRAVRSGFTYLKISCPSAVERAADEKRTSFEIQRDEWAAIRMAAGDEVYLLCCDVASKRAVVGSVDACRIGMDASRSELRNAMMEVLASYPLNGRWFAVDNDVYYMAGEIEGMCSVGGGWPVMQTWLSMVGLSCGAAITSEPLYWGAFKPHRRNVEVLTPPAAERTEVQGLCTKPNWTSLVGHVRREWGDSTVALLWNSHVTHVEPVRMNLAEAGLDPGRRYAVWSYWDNHYLGVAKGSWTTPVLLKGASQHLCFTDLDRTPNLPVLIGSNLHIYCGAAEIISVTSSRESIRIELTDAGARAGDLFVYSRWQPVFKAAAGCAVSGVINAGENVWRISLADRQYGVPQRVELAIVLPVTRQVWFWLLIATVAASLLLAGWRYVAGLKLARAHVLDQERARIARDMHDEVGASLTKIGKLASGLDDPAISETTREVVQSMDQIVWTINPRNDTLDSLANYLVHYTAEFLRSAGIACELDVPLELPRRMLSADVRHNLFLAVKEALNNAVKHGAPRLVRLELDVTAEHLTLTVRDDGCGFISETAATGADGLSNMRQRLAAIGGELELASKPGHGTTVRMHVRLSK